eukprot:gene17919-biopygen2157
MRLGVGGYWDMGLKKAGITQVRARYLPLECRVWSLKTPGGAVHPAHIEHLALSRTAASGDAQSAAARHPSRGVLPSRGGLPALSRWHLVRCSLFLCRRSGFRSRCSPGSSSPLLCFTSMYPLRERPASPGSPRLQPARGRVRVPNSRQGRPPGGANHPKLRQGRHEDEPTAPGLWRATAGPTGVGAVSGRTGCARQAALWKVDPEEPVADREEPGADPEELVADPDEPWQIQRSPRQIQRRA